MGLVLLMLAPTLVATAGVHGPKAVRAITRRMRRSRPPVAHRSPVPIERLAADLRRLLAEQPRIDQSCPMRVQRTIAVRLAVADRAADAADALGIAHAARPVRGKLDAAEVGRVLGELQASGLVISARPSASC